MPNCRTCQAAIVWVRNTATGHTMPVDAAPSEKGNIKIVEGAATVLKGDGLSTARTEKIPLHLSHFATCKESAMHRRPKPT